jgi:hypothetical protein
LLQMFWSSGKFPVLCALIFIANCNSSDNHWKWGRKNIKNKNKNKVMLAVSGVQMDLRDVSFYVKKKGGFPSLTDLGLMDIFMGGEGFSFKIQMETADATSRTHFFTISDVKVSLLILNNVDSIFNIDRSPLRTSISR